MFQVYDPRAVRVGELHDGYVNKEYTFQVDTSMAGQGDVEVEIDAGGRQIKPVVRKGRDGLCDVSFTPREAGPHGITVSISRVR